MKINTTSNKKYYDYQILSNFALDKIQDIHVVFRWKLCYILKPDIQLSNLSVSCHDYLL